MALNVDIISSAKIKNIMPELVDTVFKESPLMLRRRAAYQSANYTGIPVVSDPNAPADQITYLNGNGAYTVGNITFAPNTTTDNKYVMTTTTDTPVTQWIPMPGYSLVQIPAEKPKRQKRKRSAKVQPISFERTVSFED